jgi:ABC-type enterochelin transport system substrate-binding protein
MDSKTRAGWMAVIMGLSLLLLGACHSNRKPRSETVVKAADNTTAVEVKTAKPTEKTTEKTSDEIDLPRYSEHCWHQWLAGSRNR